MDRKSIARLLVGKYGAVEVLKFYLNDSIESLSTMRVGMAEGKEMLAAKDLELLYENVRMMRAVLGDKELSGDINATVREQKPNKSVVDK